MMIGVVSKDTDMDIIREFFELFKTPWEFYRAGRSYDVALVTSDTDIDIDSKVVIAYGSENERFDEIHDIRVTSVRKSSRLEYNGKCIPIYGRFLIFSSTDRHLLNVKGTAEIVGFKMKRKGKVVIRIGYDLPHEIRLLLSSGQPEEYAQIPTLDLHIAVLRDFILVSGLPLIEIPPRPAQHRFIACLTHDVDFVGIRRHKFDLTMFGFIFRALVMSLLAALRGAIPWGRLIKNWKAAASLPFVYLGIAKDFMIQFERYIEIEKELPSTYFFVPYKNTPGFNPNGDRKIASRATKYDIGDVLTEIGMLKRNGHEIALHGIDAWHDARRGREEMARVTQATGNTLMGVRMHWLFFSEFSPAILDDTGFYYDSTIGYNEVVGFKTGTTQVFRSPGASKMFELPMHVMDTALFYPSRMGLTEQAALKTVKRLIETAENTGGVLTVNWHHRSIGPERFWDDVYLEILNDLKTRGAWFGSARQVVEWFDQRRSVNFINIHFERTNARLSLAGNAQDHLPSMILRVHYPAHGAADGSKGSGPKVIDIPFKGHFDEMIPLH